MPTRTKRANKHDRYLELVVQFPLRPIHTEEELDRAIRMIDTLIDREHLRTEEKDYLDVLSDLVEHYEAVHHAIPPLPDGDLLSYLIEAKGVTQIEVANESGIARSTISEVIAGRRKLSRGQINKLARYFGVEPGAFTYDA